MFLQDKEAQRGHSLHEATGRRKVFLTGRLWAQGTKPPLTATEDRHLLWLDFYQKP